MNLISIIPLGFYDVLPLIWAEKSEISYTDIGIFSFLTYPVAFKMLLVPIQENFYIKSKGKYYTYIVLS